MRWSYLITRLFIIAMILIAVWIGKDPLLRRALIHSGQSVTGARVEIGQVRSSLLEGNVYLSDLAVADPRNSMRNLLQAGSAYIRLNPQSLLHRQFIIEQGTTSQLVFGSPRTKSGALDEDMDSTTEMRSAFAAAATRDIRKIGQKWLDQFHLSGNITDDQLETIKIAATIQSLWPDRIRTQQQRVNEIREQLARVNQLIEITDPNPLRDKERIETAAQELLDLQEQSETLRQQLHELRNAAVKDRDKLVAARDRDEQRLSELVYVNRFDGDLVSQILLSENQRSYANDIVRWFGWFRYAIPDPQSDFKPSNKRGVNICFAGQAKRPSLLIKTLDLVGEGRLAGQHFNFSGVAHDIALEPWLHDQPATFQLRAQGKHHLVVDCSLDRRTKTWNDSLSIRCPDLQMPNQVLGDANYLHVNVSPCRMQSEIKVTASDDRLSGSLVFRHSDFIMQIERLQDLAGGQEFADLTNLDLATINQYQIRAELGGTFDKPEIEFSSDLGAQLAKIMNRVAENQAKNQRAQQQKRLDAVLAQQFKSIDEQVMTRITELVAILNAESASIAQLKEVLPDGNSAWPRIR